MKTSNDHIYKVYFKSNGQDYYFTSLAAIYAMFTPSQIGCKVENLWNAGVSDGKPYENKLCRITREPLMRKARGMAKQAL